jgi:hypothetical protein
VPSTAKEHRKKIDDFILSELPSRKVDAFCYLREHAAASKRLGDNTASPNQQGVEGTECEVTWMTTVESIRLFISASFMRFAFFLPLR